MERRIYSKKGPKPISIQTHLLGLAAPVSKPPYTASSSFSSTRSTRSSSMNVSTDTNEEVANFQSDHLKAYVKYNEVDIWLTQAAVSRIKELSAQAPFHLVSLEFRVMEIITCTEETQNVSPAKLDKESAKKLSTEIFAIWGKTCQVLEEYGCRYEGGFFNLCKVSDVSNYGNQSSTSRQLTASSPGTSLVLVSNEMPCTVQVGPAKRGRTAAFQKIPVLLSSYIGGSKGTPEGSQLVHGKQPLFAHASYKAAAKRPAQNDLSKGPRPTKQAKVPASASTSSTQKVIQTPHSSGTIAPKPRKRKKATNQGSSSASSSELSVAKSVTSRSGRQSKPAIKHQAFPAHNPHSKSSRRSLAFKNKTPHAAEPIPEAEATPRVALPPAEMVKYCFKCHLAGAELHCSRCLLSWHKGGRCRRTVFKNKQAAIIMVPDKTTKVVNRILYADKQEWVKQLESVRDNTVCIECARKEAGYEYNTKHGFLQGVDVTENVEFMERSAACYEYATKSLLMDKETVVNEDGEQEEVQTFASLVDIDYGEYDIDNSIDLNLIMEKTQCTTAYLCTEDYMFDIHSLCHSFLVLAQMKGILAGSEEYKPLQTMCTKLATLARTEMDSVDRCDSCYRNYWEVDSSQVASDLFMTCEHSHSLVWVPHHNLWWPAKVFENRESKYYFRSEKHVYVIPFGDEKGAKFTTVKKLFTYSRYEPKTTDRMREAFDKFVPETREARKKARNQGIKDAKQYWRKYWSEYYKKPYPFHKCPKPFTVEDFYEKNGGLTKDFDEKFKFGAADGEQEEQGEDEEVSNEKVAEPAKVKRHKSKKPKAKPKKVSQDSPSTSHEAESVQVKRQKPKAKPKKTPSTPEVVEAELTVAGPSSSGKTIQEAQPNEAPQNVPSTSQEVEPELAVAGPSTSGSTNQKAPVELEHKVLVWGRSRMVLLSCSECKAIFKDIKLLRGHLKDEHNIGCKCMAKDCGRQFNHWKSLSKHVQDNHPNCDEFRCYVCNHQFPSHKGAHYHWNMEHAIGVFQCLADVDNCKYESATRRAMYTHLRSRHPTGVKLPPRKKQQQPVPATQQVPPTEPVAQTVKVEPAAPVLQSLLVGQARPVVQVSRVQAPRPQKAQAVQVYRFVQAPRDVRAPSVVQIPRIVRALPIAQTMPVVQVKVEKKNPIQTNIKS